MIRVVDRSRTAPAIRILMSNPALGTIMFVGSGNAGEEKGRSAASPFPSVLEFVMAAG